MDFYFITKLAWKIIGKQNIFSQMGLIQLDINVKENEPLTHTMHTHTQFK